MIFRESETVELKREITQDLKKEIVALANSGGGVIYIGIEDDGAVCGVEAPEKGLQQISSMIHDAIRPDLTLFTSNTIQEHQGAQLLAVAVQRGTNRPYYLKDKGLKPSGVYIRHGSSSIPASETIIRSMIVETDGTHFETIRSLNQDLTFEQSSREFQRRETGFGKAQKKTLGILNGDDLFTNLGLLLSDQCIHTIKIAVFEGLDKNIFIDRREFCGSVLAQMTDTFEYIDLHNRTRASFSGLNRIDSRDYSPSSIREALLNAIIHRDYSFSGSILVSVFDDRMEIVSLGGLVDGLTIDDILLGISQTRNEKLAALFYRLRLVEAYGTGIEKICRDYEGTKLTPHFTATHKAFQLVLPNKNHQRESHGDRINTPFSSPDEEAEQGILALISSAGSVTRREVEDTLSLKQTKAGTILRQMETKGLIMRKGAGKNTRYLLRD